MVQDQQHGDGQVIETEKVRAGATPHMTRYILSISLVLVVAGMVLACLHWA